jgi:hypothetical protein
LIRVFGFLQYRWEVSETPGESAMTNCGREWLTIESLIVILKSDRFYPVRWAFLHGTPWQSDLSFLFTLCSIVFLR